MGEPAQEVKEVQADLEGLELFFEPIQEVIQDQSKSGVEGVQDQIQGEPLMVPLSRAAEISGKARRYLLSLMHKGKLQGVKDDKGAWLVCLDQIQDRSRSRVEVVQEDVQDQGLEGVQEQIQGRAFVDAQVLLKQLQDATYRNGWLEGQLASASEQIKLLPDLQAQANKVAVQDIRLIELEKELASIKAHWWYRLWAWLAGPPAG